MSDEVKVTGIDIGFGDLVRLWIKLAVSAVPAAIILALMVGGVVHVVATVLGIR